MLEICRGTITFRAGVILEKKRDGMLEFMLEMGVHRTAYTNYGDVYHIYMSKFSADK
jgi:hypothetical protein